MPRLPRICPAGIPLHLVQRGHNRQICFASTVDYATYAHYLIAAAGRFKVEVHAWAFMTNHVHMLLTPLEGGSVSRLMQTLNRNYVCYYNSTYRRSGTLWEGRFRSCLIESTQYLLHCYRCIERKRSKQLFPGESDWQHQAGKGNRCQSQFDSDTDFPVLRFRPSLL